MTINSVARVCGQAGLIVVGGAVGALITVHREVSGNATSAPPAQVIVGPSKTAPLTHSPREPPTSRSATDDTDIPVDEHQRQAGPVDIDDDRDEPDNVIEREQAALANEARNNRWADAHEASLEGKLKELASRADLPDGLVDQVECRSARCAAKVHWPEDQSAQDRGAAIATRYFSTECGITVTTPV